MKIAIVYDWIDKWGGVERILLNLHELYPEADFYTSYYDNERAPWARNLHIQTSFIQKLPGFIKKSRILSLILYPLAFETFNFSEYDIVISVSSSFAKSVITKPQTKHISVLLTPTRYFWGQSKEYLTSRIKNIGNTFFGGYLRTWDFIAAQRIDKIVAISHIVAERCQKYYKREAEVVYPPFDQEYWSSIEKTDLEEHTVELPKGNYFLLVSRLEPYKRVDLAVETFNNLKDKTLVIVGTGTNENELKKKSNKNIVYFKNISDYQLAYLYQHAEALIMPQEEDFGYVALESQFFGCPIISYRPSGAVETINEGKTGIFFEEATSDALYNKIAEFDIISYKLKQSCAQLGKKQVESFSSTVFKRKFESIIKKYTAEKV